MRMILILSALSLFSHSSHAADSFTVVTRTSHGKAVLTQVELPELINPAFAETQDFKIVDQKSDAPLEWTKLSNEDRMRAANLLYHLTIAKRTFLDRFQSTEVASLEQVTVRINFKNSFDEIGHWKNDAKDPQFNNAHTIPKSNPADQIGIANAPTWNREIWFRPTKEIPMKELLAQLPEDPMAATNREIRQTLYPTLAQQGLASIMQSLMSSNVGPSLLHNGIRQGGTLLGIEAAFEVMKVVNRALLPKTYYLDTAMVPEIIYHEFSHVALSDYLSPRVATPVVEGMADYFASVISGSPVLAKKIKAYSKGTGKNGKKPKTFSIAYDTKEKATADFVLSMLWGIREKLGEEETNQLVWTSRKKLNTFDSTIREGDHSLAEALLETCASEHRICADPTFDRMKLLQYFSNEIGF